MDDQKEYDKFFDESPLFEEIEKEKKN